MDLKNIFPCWSHSLTSIQVMTSARWNWSISIDFIPKSFHLNEVFKNIFCTLFQVIQLKSHMSYMNSINLRKPFFKRISNINGIFMKNDGLYNRIKNKIDKPRMYQMVVPFPYCSIQVIKIRNLQLSIMIGSLYLASKALWMDLLQNA